MFTIPRFYFVAFTAALMTSPSLHAETKPLTLAQRESIEWSNLWLTHSTEAGGTRVLLIGDSIVQAFYPEVEKNLEGKAHVGRLSTSFFADDPMLIDQVNSVLKNFSFDVIYVNNGMHGWVRSEAEYGPALALLIETIRARAPKAKIILGTTTPLRVEPATPSSTQADDQRIRQRNQIAADLAQKENLVLLDMYTPVAGRPEIHSDDVHFNAQGTAIQAKVVADAIENSLKP